jgi:hypothetical protein
MTSRSCRFLRIPTTHEPLRTGPILKISLFLLIHSSPPLQNLHNPLIPPLTQLRKVLPLHNLLRLSHPPLSRLLIHHRLAIAMLRSPLQHRPQNMAGEVLGAAGGTPAQMKQRARPHHAPAQARPVLHGGLDISDGGHARLQQVHDLLEQRGLQPVGDVPGHLLLDVDGLLAQAGVEGQGGVDGGGRRGGPADDFHQRDQMGRVEGVADGEPRGVPPEGLRHGRAREARRGGEDEHAAGTGGVDRRQQGLLDDDILGPVLLHHVGIAQRRREVRRELHRRRRACGRGRPERREDLLGVLHQPPQEHLRLGVGIVCYRSEAVVREQGRPRGPDGAAAYDGDGLDGMWCGGCHGYRGKRSCLIIYT